MTSETEGIKFNRLPFGFTSEESFVVAVDNYVKKIRQDLIDRSEGIQSVDDHSRAILERAVQRRQKELAEFERRRKDPTVFYADVKEIYDKIIMLENTGLSKREIGEKFLDEGIADKVLPISGFLEDETYQKWGYPFVQSLLAAKMVRSYPQEKTSV